jgi:SAM-dependent methyltransferase
VSERQFDPEALFDEDYLFFYEEWLSGERSDEDVELIWEVLELEPGMEVLDLACGHGRIANRLASRGARVTGLDLTPTFLERARRDATERGVEVEYVQGDMRELPWSEHFDRIVNWFTAYGYFEDEDNRRVLAEAHRALRPGGRLLIENNNVARFLREFRPATVVARDGDLMVDIHEFDPLTCRALAERITVRSGKVRRTTFFVRVFLYSELRDWLLSAGFSSVDGLGDEGEPLSAESRRMITIARK